MTKMIDREKFLQLQKDKSAKVIDVLTEEHYQEEHIKGAISIPVDKIEKEAPDKLSKDDLVITYCANTQCTASTQAAQKLETLGYKNVYDYKPGLEDYKKSGLPIEGKKENPQSFNDTKGIPDEGIK